jgi:hypothetical protein
LDLLKEKKPQVTFSCNKDAEDCNFQCIPHIALLPRSLC